MAPTPSPTPETAPNEQYTISTGQFYAECYTALPIGIILCFVYCIVRLKCLERCESRRRKSQKASGDDSITNWSAVNSKDDSDANSSESLPVPIEHPNLSGTAFLSWIWEVVKMDSNTFYEYAGFDALVMILMLKAFIFTCIACLPYALIVLLPVYGTGSIVDIDSGDHLELISMKNVGTKDHRLIACGIGVYVLVLSAIYFLKDVYLKVAAVADPYWLSSKATKGNIDDIAWFKHREYRLTDLVDKIKERRSRGKSLKNGDKEESLMDDVEMEIHDESKDSKEEEMNGDNQTDGEMIDREEIDESKEDEIMEEEQKLDSKSPSIVPVESESEDDGDENNGIQSFISKSINSWWRTTLDMTTEKVEEQQLIKLDSIHSNSQSIFPAEPESFSGDGDHDANKSVESEVSELESKTVELVVNHDVPVSREDVPSVQHYTVMIRSLPDRLKIHGNLESKLRGLFENDIARVYVVPNVRPLWEIQEVVEKHQSKLKALAKKYDFKYDDVFYDVFNGNGVPEIMGRLNCCGKCGFKVNLVEHHKTEYEKAVKELNELRDTIELEPTSTAFVTFKSTMKATMFIRSAKSLEFVMTDVTMAPEPKDIYWENFIFDPNMLMCRKFVIRSLMVLLLFCLSIPVGAIIAMADLQSLFDRWGVETTDNFIGGFLSVSMLRMFLFITLPPMMEIFTKMLMPSHRGQLEIGILKRLYQCFIFMVMLVTVMASALISSGGQIFSSFSLDLLSHELSSMSLYFMLYIMNATFISLPIELYRITYHIKDFRNKPEANRFFYSVWIPQILLIFTIVLTYSVMNPIMLIFGLLYFLTAYVVFKYHLSMSWVPAFTMGPDTWVAIFNLVRYSFFIAQLTLYGIMLSKKYIPGLLLLPLMYYSWTKTAEIMARFESNFKSTSLSAAKARDERYPAPKELFEGSNPYQPPVLVSQYRLSE